MPISNVSLADTLHAQRDGATYVDVRSSLEFAAGHPAGAINVPLLEADEDTGQLMPNPDFVRVMKATFAPDTALLLGCESGTRSARAAQILEAFGFSNLANVAAGFQGWAAAGLPTETTAPTDRAYAGLLRAAAVTDT
ncbi:MAG: rhodanese-like domain-containing protein [Acidobacteria bacterium]|nr:rhodanese-like domain-containing protein [Acidobacteriota bacterium]